MRRPPLRPLAAYRLWSSRPDRRYDDWLWADLTSRTYALRRAAWWAPIGLALTLAAALLAAQPWWLALVATAVVTACGAVQDERRRAATRDRFFPESVPPEVGHFQPYRAMESGPRGDA